MTVTMCRALNRICRRLSDTHRFVSTFSTHKTSSGGLVDKQGRHLGQQTFQLLQIPQLVIVCFQTKKTILSKFIYLLGCKVNKSNFSATLCLFKE